MKGLLVKLDLYSDKKYKEKLNNYILKNNSQVGHPLQLIKKFSNQKDRIPIVILNNTGILVGFFYLHLNDGPSSYGYFDQNIALIRGFSIDDRFQNRGYASEGLTIIFPFVNEHINSKIDKLILVVHIENIPAIKAYRKAGFTKRLKTIEGNLDILQKSK